MFMSFKKPAKINTLKKDIQQIIQGTVSVPREVTLPGTSVSCAAFWMMTEAWKRPDRGKGRKMWTPVDVKQETNGFFIEDDTGKIWVENNGNALDLRSGTQQSGRLGKKETSRFVARIINNGDIVRIQGIVSSPKAKEPQDTLVIRPGKKGLISIILKKKFKN
jgi:hypothetical protein